MNGLFLLVWGATQGTSPLFCNPVANLLVPTVNMSPNEWLQVATFVQLGCIVPVCVLGKVKHPDMWMLHTVKALGSGC